ncbi:MAG: hypothetical protein NT062_19600 [Proteobacteria bacterium]|nr:hypothetical protein [Pseudomonadota bacterium]
MPKTNVTKPKRTTKPKPKRTTKPACVDLKTTKRANPASGFASYPIHDFKGAHVADVLVRSDFDRDDPEFVAESVAGVRAIASRVPSDQDLADRWLLAGIALRERHPALFRQMVTRLADDFAGVGGAL